MRTFYFSCAFSSIVEDIPARIKFFRCNNRKKRILIGLFKIFIGSIIAKMT